MNRIRSLVAFFAPRRIAKFCGFYPGKRRARLKEMPR